MKPSLFYIPLGFLVIVAFLGTLMRYMQVFPLEGLDFRYLVHSHSHTAFMGWVYNALYLLMVNLLLPEQVSRQRIFKVLFWLLQITVIGMTIAFALQGYKAISITLSTLHTLLFYVFIGVFFHRLKKHPQQRFRLSRLFIKAAMFFMLLSSIGPWALAVISAKGLAGTPIYNAAIYFYLHFQYNGFFLFAIAAIVFYFLEKRNVPLQGRWFQVAFWALFASQFPNYALSLMWLGLPIWLNFVVAVSSMVQLAVLGYFTWFVFKKRNIILTGVPPFGKVFFVLASWAFLLKIAVQSISWLPFLQPLTYAYKEAVMGYLHLSLLAFTSLILLAFAVKLKWLKIGPVLAFPVSVFLFGMLVNIASMLVQGTAAYLRLPSILYYQEVLYYSGVLMVIGLAIIFVGQLVYKLSENYIFHKAGETPRKLLSSAEVEGNL